MKLYIMRHAEAESGTPDEDRQLTDKGRRQAKEVAEFLKEKKGIKLPKILVSPLVRAQQTADQFTQHFPFDGIMVTDPKLTPYDNPRETLESIRKEELPLMLIGHNPHLESLVSVLVTGRMNPPAVRLKKAGLVCLEAPDSEDFAKENSWIIRWMLIPKLLR